MDNRNDPGVQCARPRIPHEPGACRAERRAHRRVGTGVARVPGWPSRASDGVRQVIWDSWRRSVEAGIEPGHNDYRFVAPHALAATLAHHRALIAAAAQVMHGLLAYNPRGHINLTDAEGTTLYFAGWTSPRWAVACSNRCKAPTAPAWPWPKIAWCMCWRKKISPAACASATCTAPPRRSRMPKARPWPCSP